MLRSSRDIIRRLELDGWVLVGGKGSQISASSER